MPAHSKPLTLATNPDNPPVLKNSVWSATTSGAAFQFAFTNVSGADFIALMATNVALPLSNGTNYLNLTNSTGSLFFRLNNP